MTIQSAKHVLHIFPALALATAFGCSRQPDLMPLHVGRSTTYVVRSGFDSYVAPIRVSREMSVAGTTGYELTSLFGTSRLAWRSGVLYAGQTANAVFDPPVPILSADGKHRLWHGAVTTLQRVSRATGELNVTKSKTDVGGQMRDTTEALLTLTLPKGKIELDSWFEAGVGLVQQDQRTNDKLVVHMEILGSVHD